MSFGCVRSSSGLEWLSTVEDGLLSLARRKDITENARNVLIDAASIVAWDDAIHIAAPWDGRTSLCGHWYRNLTSLDGPRPDSISGCWTCLSTAEWFDKQKAAA